jgi:hypothetical protein
MKRKSERACVYLISDEVGKVVKIGVSKDPRKRLKQLQTSHANTLTLVDWIFCNDPYKREEILHDKYKHLRVRPDGEWFNQSPEINLYMKIEPKGTMEDMLKAFEGQTSYGRPMKELIRKDIHKTSTCYLCGAYNKETPSKISGCFCPTDPKDQERIGAPKGKLRWIWYGLCEGHAHEKYSKTLEHALIHKFVPILQEYPFVLEEHCV